MRVFGRGNVDPKVLAQGAFDGRWGLIGPCPFSRTELAAASCWASAVAESVIDVRVSPIPSVAAPGPLGRPPRGPPRVRFSPHEDEEQS